MKEEIQSEYEAFNSAVKTQWDDSSTHEKAVNLSLKVFDWCLSESREELESKVPGKEYFRFHGKKFGSEREYKSRPVNQALWIGDRAEFETLLKSLEDIHSTPIEPDELNRCLYTASVAFSCSQDATKDSRKRPGTFFEHLIRYVFSRFFQIGAKTSLPIRSTEEGKTENLTVDLTFDLGLRKPKFIVPAKTSTRERIIQVWAHQRIIDGVFGMGRYRGLPVFLGETKGDKEKGIVTEICTPLQLGLLNWYVSRMWQVAYLDIPQKYADLQGDEDDFPICSLGELLGEGGRLRKVLERKAKTLEEAAAEESGDLFDSLPPS